MPLVAQKVKCQLIVERQKGICREAFIIVLLIKVVMLCLPSGSVFSISLDGCLHISENVEFCNGEISSQQCVIKIKDYVTSRISKFWAKDLAKDDEIVKELCLRCDVSLCLKHKSKGIRGVPRFALVKMKWFERKNVNNPEFLIQQMQLTTWRTRLIVMTAFRENSATYHARWNKERELFYEWNKQWIFSLRFFLTQQFWRVWYASKQKRDTLHWWRKKNFLW